jgi:hypothetical protein
MHDDVIVGYYRRHEKPKAALLWEQGVSGRTGGGKGRVYAVASEGVCWQKGIVAIEECKGVQRCFPTQSPPSFTNLRDSSKMAPVSENWSRLAAKRCAVGPLRGLFFRMFAGLQIFKNIAGPVS